MHRTAIHAGRWGDQGDGSYANPVLPGDFSDLDAIRVGDDYYAISSTLHFSPGIIVLHSHDLVNWSILGHAVSDLTQIGPQLDWNAMERYGRGIWAPALRYHAGRYWIYFCTPDEGLFVTTAAHPRGPWTPLHQVFAAAGWDDCCPFWDDDGTGYLVAAHFAGGYSIHLFQLTPDGLALVPETDFVIHQSAGSEASKLFKHNGFYYHFFSEVSHEGRVPMMGRAPSITGPYEIRQLMHVDPATDKEPNQGGLVQLPNGDWYFLTHQGTGDWEGRAACLLPVSWENGWPIPGRIGSDGVGSMVWQAAKPIGGFVPTELCVRDDFGEPTLGPQWEWNHQPRADKWSLHERAGWLRLHAFMPLRKGDFRLAGNTLSQRSMRTAGNCVTLAMDVSGMADGQQTGLCHFSLAYSLCGVVQREGVRRLYAYHEEHELLGPPIEQPMIWLQSHWGADGMSRYGYSLDGVTFTQFGAPYQLQWGAYRGDRFGMYCFNDIAERGFVDIDFVDYDCADQHGNRLPA